MMRAAPGLACCALAVGLAAGCGDDSTADDDDDVTIDAAAEAVDAAAPMPDAAAPGCFDEQAAFAEGNQFGTDPELADPFDGNAPDFAPAAGSPALSGPTPPGGFFDLEADYYGAV